MPANARNDLVDDMHQVSVVLEANVGLFQNPGAFYIDLLMPIHQDVVDSWVLQKRLQRTQAENLVQNFQRESLSFTTAQGCLKVGDQILNHCQCLAASALVAHGCNFFHVDLIQKIAMNTGFEFLINLKIQTCSFPVIGDGDSHDSTRRNDMIQITHDPPLLTCQDSAIPEPQQSATLLLLIFCANLPAHTCSPILQIPCHIGSGKLAGWVTAANGLYDMQVLIWNLPENFLSDAFFNLCFCNQSALLMAI